jgi:Domain of unknown function (DUF3850)
MNRSETHELKCWPEPFKAIQRGTKTFEVRKNDRDFAVGDCLQLRCYNPITGEYESCDPLFMWVNYILEGPQFGIEAGYAVMSISEHKDRRR